MSIVDAAKQQISSAVYTVKDKVSCGQAIWGQQHAEQSPSSFSACLLFAPGFRHLDGSSPYQPQEAGPA